MKKIRFIVDYCVKNKWKGNPDTEMPSGGSGLGYVLPLAILMVAGPMNPVSAAEQYNRYMAAQPTELIYTPQEESLPEDTYMLVPSTQEPEKKMSRAFGFCLPAGTQYLQLTGYSTDSIKDDAEKVFFIYKDNNKNPNYQLKAKLFAFCPTPRNDGRYIILMGIEGDTKIKIASIPDDFFKAFTYATAKKRNNHAVKILSMDELLAKRGAEYVNNSIPPIEDFVPTPEQQSKCVATGD